MKINLPSYDKEEDEEENNKILNDQDEYYKGRNIEQMQVLNNPEKNDLNLSPEEQYKDYPNYHFFKIFGILFCKIGYTYNCNFDNKNNNSPKICIGPQWYLALFTNILIIVLVSTMFAFLVELKCSLILKFIYLLLGLIVLYFFNRCALINPGIIQNKKMNIDNVGYCSICQVYYNPNNNVEHCSMCGICVENIDHHCVWVGKCVAKNNKFSFYAMLFSIGLIYAYIMLIGLLKYVFRKKNKIIKNE